MKTIEIAGMIGGLLRAKQRYDKARQAAKPYISDEIAWIRKLLGMSTGLPEGVADRVKSHPIDLSKTMTAVEYEQQVKKWLPYSFVSFDGIDDENAKGMTKALQDVLVRYPKIAEGGGCLNSFSSTWKFDELRKANKKNEKAEIESIIKRDRILDRFPKAIEETFLKEAARVKEIRPVSLNSYEAASLARSYGIGKESQIKKLCKNGTIETSVFLEACWEAIRMIWAKKEALVRLKKENPGLMRWNSLSMNLNNSEIQWTLAFYFKLMKSESTNGVLFCPAFRGSYLRSSYKESVEKNFHPQGTDGDDPHKAAEAVTMHELGHALDYFLGICESKEFKSLKKSLGTKYDISEQVSLYAMKSDRELIAEAFCEYKTSASPRPVALAIGRMIDNAYDKKFGASS